MEFEFDKEMDAILRRARVGEAAASFDSHLDADEISAFAENAVSEPARMRYTAHLADCARCRKILSNVVLLNAEAGTEKTASSAVPVETVKEKTSWYRRIFAFPQLAYTMGAMVVLLSGFFVYLILQNLSSADRAVSYSTNTTANRPAPQSAPISSNANTAANTSAPAANTSAPMNAPANTAPLSASNSTVAAATPAEKKSAETVVPMSEATPAATPAAKPIDKDETDDKNLAMTQNEARPGQPSPAGVVREEEKRDKETFKTEDATGSSKDEQKAKTTRSAPQALKKQAGETRSVGGKTFNNVGGIWFDSAVGKQKPKTVRRGTNDYQKLDAGLRSIADQLGGTVVILWGGKAYRIQ